MNPVAKVRVLAVVLSADFKWAVQCATAAQSAGRELFRLRSVLSRRKKIFVPLYKAIVRPHLEYCVQAWPPPFKKDAAILKRVQRLATRMVKGQKFNGTGFILPRTT